MTAPQLYDSRPSRRPVSAGATEHHQNLPAMPPFDSDADTLADYIGPLTCFTPRRMQSTDVRVQLGFPLPSVDFSEDDIDLGELLVPNPLASYLYRASGWSMILAGIADGAILVVDRSLDPADGDIVIATWEGCQPVCKVLRMLPDRVVLESRNPRHKAIEIPPGTELEVFCVRAVAHVLRRH